MFSIIFLSLLSLGCSNEVPPDSAEADGPLSSTESPSDGTGSSDGNVSTSSSEEEGSTSSDTSASDGASDQAPVDADGDGGRDGARCQLRIDGPSDERAARGGYVDAVQVARNVAAGRGVGPAWQTAACAHTLVK